MSTAVTEPSWYERAACRATGPEAYFDDTQASAARETCAGCPVRQPCLSFALRNHIADGIWGGLSPSERRRLAARQAA